MREFTAQQMKVLSNEEIRALGLRTPDLHQIEQAEIPSAATSEVVLEVKKLNHSFGETIVAKDVDFQCRKGEVVALIGPNGTGKSTIAGLRRGADVRLAVRFIPVIQPVGKAHLRPQLVRRNAAELRFERRQLFRAFALALAKNGLCFRVAVIIVLRSTTLVSTWSCLTP